MSPAADLFWVVFAAPLAASALTAVGWRRTAIISDSHEKRYLGLTIAPAILGLAVILLLPLVPPDIRAGLARLPYAEGLSPIALRNANPIVGPTWLNVADALWGGLFTVYGVILVIRATALIRALSALRRLAVAASPQEVAGMKVSVTQAAQFPMVLGREIILPKAFLDHFTPAELRLVILHESAHRTRGDAAWFMALAWLEVVFWFNPFVREQTGRCRIAAEKACDAFVVSTAPQARELYARTLVKTLRHTAGNALACVPAVISHNQSGDYRMRLKDIMEPGRAAGKPRTIYAVMAMAILMAAGVGQFAYAHIAQGGVGFRGESLVAQTACRNDGSGAMPCQLSAEKMTINDAKTQAEASGRVILEEKGSRQIEADTLVLNLETGEARFVGSVRVSENKTSNK